MMLRQYFIFIILFILTQDFIHALAPISSLKDIEISKLIQMLNEDPRNNSIMAEVYDRGGKNRTYKVGQSTTQALEKAAECIFSTALPQGFCNKKNLLDLGIGSALASKAAAKANIGSITGIDISIEMLKWADEILSGFPNIPRKMILGDIFNAEELTKTNGKSTCFDIISIANATHFFNTEQKTLLLRSLIRLLSPDGYLVILVRSVDDRGMVPKGYEKILKDSGYTDVHHFIGSEEIDADWGLELDWEREVVVNKNYIIVARRPPNENFTSVYSPTELSA